MQFARKAPRLGIHRRRPSLRCHLVWSLGFALLGGPLAAQSNYATPYAFTTTLAGAPSANGNANGTGSAARFASAYGMAIDPSGNLYVADTFNNAIRKVTPAGVVTTFAGVASTSSFGTADGTGPAAQFSYPYGVAIDASGNLYVTDEDSNLVRKITPAAVVTTLVPASGNLAGPTGIAVDAAGNVYISDTQYSSIRKVSPSGVLSSLAGNNGVGSSDGTGTAARFAGPSGLAVDANGNVYVADFGNDTIRKITPQGVVTTVAGAAGVAGSADGTGSAARFSYPNGLTIDAAGNLYVTEAANNDIRKVTPAGVVTTLAGTSTAAGFVNGIGPSALFNAPTGIAVDGSGNLYVQDSNGDVIRKGSIPPPTPPPAFTSGPQSLSTSTGQSVTFTSAASGSPTYQWLFNNTAISGATNASLTLTNVTVASAGTYSVVATNAGGSVSASATLTVAAVAVPAFAAQPSPQTVVSGSTVVFNSVASGSPAPTFQWKLNGTAISGATSARLVVSGATAANAGSYTCVATNSQGSVTTTAAVLTLAATTNAGRLVNLSVNTTAGKSQVLTVGFVSGGSGTTGSENLLIRATGPALAGLGVPATLADPTLTVLSGSIILVSNDNWATPTANQTAVTAADTATFAFPLGNPASLDAAVAQAFSAGADTVQVSGNGTASGTALAEVYDNTPTASYTLATPRLINLSAKNQIVAGGSMTAGFVVGGSTSKTVLIRATGPALALLGVTGTIPDPQLALHTTTNGQDTVLAANAGWGGDPQITAASNSVFAFPLTNSASADSVVLVTLAPGAYTAVASSVSAAGGTVLIEVYEVP